MNEYTYLIMFSICKSAKDWGKIVENNSPEKIDILWRDRININKASYNCFIEKRNKNKYKSVEWCARETDLYIIKSLNVLGEVLSYFIGYKPNMKEFEVKLCLT